jgi:hypothetical protein
MKFEQDNASNYQANTITICISEFSQGSAAINLLLNDSNGKKLPYAIASYINVLTKKYWLGIINIGKLRYVLPVGKSLCSKTYQL